MPLPHTRNFPHEIIRENLDRSPIYAGIIEGTGPRYCPSIEDKVVKFSDKDRQQGVPVLKRNISIPKSLRESVR